MNYLLKAKLAEQTPISAVHKPAFAWGEEHLDYHPHYELYFCPHPIPQLISVNGDRHEVNAPVVVISSPYSVHTMRPQQVGRIDFDRYAIYFGEAFFQWFSKTLFPEHWFAENANTILFPKEETVTRLCKHLRGMLVANASVQEMGNCFVGFLLTLSREVDAANTVLLRQTASEIPRILQYIHRNPEKDLSMKFLTREFGVSYAKLKRDFSRSIGKPLHKVVMESRLSCAMKLLRSTDRTVGEIAALCGFENEYYFYSFFKRTAGITPLQYRKKCSFCK